MNRKENLITASDRLKEAQQLLLLVIEKENISSIDRELILEKLRKAYDLLLFEKEVEKQIVTAPTHVQPIKVNVEKAPEIPLKQTVPEIKPQGKIEPAPKKSQISENTKTFERTSIFDPIVKVIPDEVVEERVEEIPKSNEQSILDIQNAESLAEKFQGKRKFMTDSLSNQIRTKPVAKRLQDKPIDDLTKEIGVHDKFMFIKELFNGDSISYEETLNKVNQFEDITDALIYIQENFNWNNNNKAAGKFIDLIRRKLLND